VCLEVLCADEEVYAQRELLKQTDMVRVKNRSATTTEPGKLIRCAFVYPSDRKFRLQEEAMEVMRENGTGCEDSLNNMESCRYCDVVPERGSMEIQFLVYIIHIISFL
jgi:hypothetical protein